MRRRPNASIPKVVLAGLTVAVVAALVVAGTTSSAAFGPYNADWDGSTELRSVAGATGTDVSVARGTAAYSSTPADGTVAFVLSPESSYSPSDAARVADFVQGGGTLVVAGDVGPNANDLLRSVNASARVDGTPLRDAGSNYRSPAMPVATGVANHSLVAGVESLTLNYGTAVEPRGATPLVNTSASAYLDADRDGELGANESLGSYSVATVERVGDGRVVAVGDPSLFINAMLDRPGNRQFVRVLAVQHDRVLFDASHAGGLPPLTLALLVARESVPLQFGLAALAVGALAVWSRRPDLSRRPELPDAELPDGKIPDAGRRLELLDAVPGPWRKFGGTVLRAWRISDESDDGADAPADPADGRATTSELADHLERRHPGWDRDRVERVAAALERARDR